MKLYTILVVFLISLAPVFAVQMSLDGNSGMGGHDGTGVFFDPTYVKPTASNEPTLEAPAKVAPVVGTPKNYYPSEEDLMNGYSKCMKIGKRIYFDFEGVKQSVSLKNTKDDHANFAFSFDEEFSFLPGDMATFDVNEDGVDDYSVELLGFCNENRAEFLVTALFESEKVAEEEVEEAAPVKETPSVIPNDKPAVRSNEPAGNALTGFVAADAENTGNRFSEWLKNLFKF